MPAAGAPVILATTTSTQDSGLLDVLIPAFERASGYQVKTIAAGSGEAIEMGARGEADVILAHSPAAEEALMADGKGGSRRTVMHNDFVVVGPAADPARIKGRSAADALDRIAAAEAPFVSRGDDSGTHVFELGLWEDAGVTPEGAWYQESGQGMGATLQIANDKRGYTISDRGTYLATESARDLEILVEGGSELLNVYHVIDVAPAAGERVNAAGGKAFADWLVAPGPRRRSGRSASPSSASPCSSRTPVRPTNRSSRPPEMDVLWNALVEAFRLLLSRATPRRGRSSPARCGSP